MKIPNVRNKITEKVKKLMILHICNDRWSQYTGSVTEILSTCFLRDDAKNKKRSNLSTFIFTEAYVMNILIPKIQPIKRGSRLCQKFQMERGIV